MLRFISNSSFKKRVFFPLSWLFGPVFAAFTFQFISLKALVTVILTSEPNLEGLSTQEDGEGESFYFDVENEGGEVSDLQFCLVGRFLSDIPIHVKSMKARMEGIWRPVKKVMIKEAMDGRFLF